MVPVVELLSSHLSMVGELGQQMVSGRVYWMPESTHSAVLLDSLKVQLEALSAHSAIDQDACRKLRALIDDIERDIDRARTIGDRAPG